MRSLINNFFFQFQVPRAVIFSKRRISRHCSGVTSVANACGDCIDKAFSALSVAFNVTGNVCLTMLLCVQEDDSGKGEKVIQKVISVTVPPFVTAHTFCASLDVLRNLNRFSMGGAY